MGLESLSMEVVVEEQRNLTKVAAPILEETRLEGERGEVKEVALVREGPGRARVTYQPRVGDLGELGNSLKFRLEYDVERVDGEVLLMDGHFVHFLAPDQLPVLRQHVVFVIDSSGSMSGRKMKQTKEAMATILRQIRPTDFFSILDFDSEVKDVLMAMTGSETNIESALEAVKQIEASGGTNIHGALLRALEILDQAEIKELQPLIIFLTDGQPSSGVTDPAKIQANVRSRNRRGLAIFSLAFGTGADFDMLQKLSLQNHGFARKIYEGGDAANQLEGFYYEVASPLLSGVNFTYVGNSVDEESLTETSFHTFYKGSEMVVAGRLRGVEGDQLKYNVEGLGTDVYSQAGHQVELIPLQTSRTMDKFLAVSHQNERQGFLERLWAFLRARELLDQIDATEDEAGKATALKLALNYGFVTPLTSLVVVKNDEGQELGEPKEETLDRVDNKYHLAHDNNNNPSANFPSSGSGNIQFLNSTRAMCIVLFIALCQSMFFE